MYSDIFLYREYRGVCEELLNTEFKSEDILDNPVLASALNIKMEPGYILKIIYKYYAFITSGFDPFLY